MRFKNNPHILDIILINLKKDDSNKFPTSLIAMHLQKLVMKCFFAKVL